MPAINAQTDPLAFMSFLNTASWTKFTFTFDQEGDTWSTIRQVVEDLLDIILEGQFSVMLGDESKLTDTSAEYIIRTAETTDLCKVGVGLEHIQSLIDMRVKYAR